MNDGTGRGSRFLVASCAALLLGSTAGRAGPGTPDVFVGPFPHWLDLRADFGAAGDGAADDTAALRAAFAAIEESGGYRTLYLPPGTYRLTDTVRMTGGGNLRIVGEHPERVVLRWDGPEGRDMLAFNGVNRARFGRLTLDGASRAGAGLHVAIDYEIQGANFPTGWGVHDVHFVDLDTGVRAGVPNCQSEASYERCVFRRCGTGVALRDANTANIWIRHALFEDCGRGVDGFQHGTVLNSVFRRSRDRDIGGENLGYFGVRNCYSVGSRRFYENVDALDGRSAVFQGNRVIDPTDPVPILLTGAGPLTFYDNVVRSPEGAGAPVIERGRENNTAALFVGNTFTAGSPETAIRAYGPRTTGRIVDSRVVGRDEVDAAEPALPAAPGRIPSDSPRVFRPAEFSGRAIQAAIREAAAAYPDSPSIVYLRQGEYEVGATIEVPPGVPLRILGDASEYSGMTTLAWASEDRAPMFRLRGPGSRATLDSLFIDGRGRASTILVEEADQPGGRVFIERHHGDGINTPRADVGLLVDGLDWTRVESYAFMASGSTAIRIVGGPRTAAGEATTAGFLGWNAAIFGGPSATEPLLDVARNGRLLLVDNWFENGGWPHRHPILDLDGSKSGTVTLQGYKMQHHTRGVGESTTMRIDGFDGRVTVLNILLQNVVAEIGGENPRQNVLFATNTLAWGDANGAVPDANARLTLTAAAGEAAVIQSAQAFPDFAMRPRRGRFAHTYPYQHPVGDPTDEWLRAMMAHGRAERPGFGLAEVPEGATDVRILWITATKVVGNAIEIRGPR